MTARRRGRARLQSAVIVPTGPSPHRRGSPRYVAQGTARNRDDLAQFLRRTKGRRSRLRPSSNPIPMHPAAGPIYRDRMSDLAAPRRYSGRRVSK